jgi:IS4 transposase
MPVLTIYESSIQAALYKHRWKVEFLFKWIKQRLKIKSFGGTTQNTVNTRVYIAVIAYTLVPIIWHRLKTAYTTYDRQFYSGFF